jgi:hypothetical protein
METLSERLRQGLLMLSRKKQIHMPSRSLGTVLCTVAVNTPGAGQGCMTAFHAPEEILLPLHPVRLTRRSLLETPCAMPAPDPAFSA